MFQYFTESFLLQNTNLTFEKVYHKTKKECHRLLSLFAAVLPELLNFVTTAVV